MIYLHKANLKERHSQHGKPQFSRKNPLWGKFVIVNTIY